VGQGGQPLGDGPEPVQPEGVHGQASERGHDLNAVGFAVAVVILAELGVAGPVPGILDRPTVPHVAQQSLGASAQTRDVVTGLIDGLPSRMPLLRTAITVALPGQFSTTHSGAGMPRSVQVMSRPCPRSRLLAWSGAFLP
jgi:hypothetical protein